ncbi:hypothetical protein B0H11DRAFT_1935406 [Mycena galericulata]|nr:hypothetical protein B0H11DRAFT_1935406 [Mycena galericulata]
MYAGDVEKDWKIASSSEGWTHPELRLLCNTRESITPRSKSYLSTVHIMEDPTNVIALSGVADQFNNLVVQGWEASGDNKRLAGVRLRLQLLNSKILSNDAEMLSPSERVSEVEHEQRQPDNGFGDEDSDASGKTSLVSPTQA